MATPTRAPLPSPVDAPPFRYTFLAELGRGGNGVVYLAERRQGPHAQRVAIKVLEPSYPQYDIALSRFVDEYDFLSRRVHECFPAAYERLLVEGREAFAMEFVDGRSLGSADFDRRRLPPRIVAAIGAVVARALAYGWDYAPHGRGPLRLLHRDLKPDNLFLTQTGAVKILDLGAARSADEYRGSNTRLLGARPITPFYAAPEALRGVDGAPGDVWSLGMTLAVLAGGGPVSGPSPGAAVLSAVPAVELRELLARTLAEAPEERPSMRALAEALEALTRSLPGPELHLWAVGAETEAGAMSGRPRSDTFLPDVSTASALADAPQPTLSPPSSSDRRATEPVMAAGADVRAPLPADDLRAAPPRGQLPPTSPQSVLVPVRRAALGLGLAAAVGVAGIAAFLALGGGDPDTAPPVAALPTDVGAAGSEGVVGGTEAGSAAGSTTAGTPTEAAREAQPNGATGGAAGGSATTGGAGGSPTTGGGTTDEAWPGGQGSPGVGAPAGAVATGSSGDQQAGGSAGNAGGTGASGGAGGSGSGATTPTTPGMGGVEGSRGSGTFSGVSGGAGGGTGSSSTPSSASGPSTPSTGTQLTTPGATAAGSGTVLVEIRGYRACSVAVAGTTYTAAATARVAPARYTATCTIQSATEAGASTQTRETAFDLAAGQTKAVVCDTNTTRCGTEAR